MTLEFDVFWSFRSPYSYLATHRLVAIERDYDVTLNFRPVYPIAIRMPGFFDHIDPRWLGYLLRDAKRVADMEGLPFVWPNPDPIVQDLTTRKILDEQPYIFRLTRLGVAACKRGRGLAFADEMSRMIFSGITNWHEGDHMAGAVNKAGLDLAELDAEINADPDGHDALIKQNEADQAAANHWGVPLMVFNGEPFFGQDRLDVLLWRMQQAGLQKRA